MKIAVNANHNDTSCVHGIDLHLHRSTKLLDDNFVFIKRDENQTQLIDDFDKLAEKYSNCFYRNENSAIDLCDGNVVSSVFLFEFIRFHFYLIVYFFCLIFLISSFFSSHFSNFMICIFCQYSISIKTIAWNFISKFT